MSCVLELREVSRDFGSVRAIDNLSLRVEPGELFALLGPSGCGKTTTLRLIAGFDQPSRGEIHLDGVRIDHLKPYDRNVSTVFQNYALFPHLTVRGNIEFGLRRKGIASIDARVREMVGLLQLEGKENRLPAQLSGGEKQRVALARSLVLGPKVLLLDEPLSALDPNLRKQVRAELKALQRRTGIAFVFVTHDRDEALSLSDRIALLNRGRLEQVGAPRELYDNPASRFAAAFVGPVNWVDAAGIRPEQTRVSRTEPTASPRVRAIVRQSVFLGNLIHVECELERGGGAVAEVARSEDGYAPGEPVWLHWEAAHEIRVHQ